MGDRNYYPNHYNPFMASNYNSYSQFQQHQQMSFYPNSRSSHGGGFTVNTSMPVYNTGAPSNQAQNSGRQPSQSRDGSQQYHDERPPPSYEESHSDKLLSKSNTSKKYSPAWNYVDDKGEEKQNPQKNSFSSFFDIPGQTEAVQKSPDWSSDNYSSIQSYQNDPQGRFNPHSNFSQQPPITFSSDYGCRLDYRFSQNNQRGFGKQNKNRGRGRGGFRGRGNWQKKGKSRDGGNRQGLDKSGGVEGVVTGSEEGRNMEFEEQVRGSDEEGNEEDRDGDGDNGASEKVNAYIPDPSLVTKYEYYPPSPEEMGEMFKDLVIHFFYKLPKNKKEQNPFVVICEAFRRSAGYCNIEVEDGYDVVFKDRKFCTLRYRGMMLVRGVGENNCLKEPRVLAGVELINKLAMSCYTLESKEEYFSVKAFERMLEKGSVPGVYTIAPKEEAGDYDSARNYLQLMFSKEDSDVEYMFHFPNNKDGVRLKSWANKQNPKFDVRTIKDEWIGIYRHRTTQYWRDKILASGSTETEKFILKPPQGIGNLLLQDFDIKEAIAQLKARPRPRECTLENVYGPPGVGPKISRALPPWERRGGSMRTKKNRQKEKKIMQQLKQGVPLTEAKGYRYLSQRKKRNLKKKLGQ